VKDGRVRVQVDGRGLAPGSYTATIVNLATGATAVSKPQTTTPRVRNADFDFDSTAGAGDLDTFVPATFAQAGQQVQTTINPGAIATAAGACTR
jgi:hypothetical protein